MHRTLTDVAHRPWPLPAGPWIMAQTWHDLLFAHWRIDAALLRPLIPAPLEIDTFQNEAWIGVVPFRMSGVRLRATPALPALSAFPELNVRTYVTYGGKPGVWFFSLDAANAIAVSVARAWFHLPYFNARMRCESRNGWIEYTSERTHRGAASAKLRARYRPAGEIFLAQTRHARTFPDRAILPLRRRWERSNQARRHPARPVVASTRRSHLPRKLNDQLFGVWRCRAGFARYSAPPDSAATPLLRPPRGSRLAPSTNLEP